jgi:DNA-binding response OmpR family regulator
MREKILLVDDDAAIRGSLSDLLAMENYEVLPAANGAEALKIYQTNAVDVVLLDLNLPIKNGWDTFVQLTNDNPLLPVIIITARANQRFTSMGAGVGALMEKPLDFPLLLETIRELLEEPAELRLKRMTGKVAEFHYFPAHRQTTSRFDEDR